MVGPIMWPKVTFQGWVVGQSSFILGNLKVVI